MINRKVKCSAALRTAPLTRGTSLALVLFCFSSVMGRVLESITNRLSYHHPWLAPVHCSIPVRNGHIIMVSCALLTSRLLLGHEQQDCVIVEGINMKLFYIQQDHLLLISSNIVKKTSTQHS